MHFCLLACFAGYAQEKTAKTSSVAGTYTLVLADNLLADGSRIHLYGDDPYGLLMLDSAGHYSLQILSRNRLRFAAGDKSKGTDEENRLTVQGSNAHFGTYAIDPKKHTITFSIIHAFFPNWEGTKQTRPFEFNGSIFKYKVPTPTTGAAVTGEVVWKRVD
jgi:hypothetical protein